MAGNLPQDLRRLLRRRRTNIVGYEVMAALLGIYMVDDMFPHQAFVRHFVDNQPALNAIIRGSSKQDDLNSLVGSVWYGCASKLQSYWGQYVRSKANLSDGPSRQEFQLMRQLNIVRIPFCVDKLRTAAESWMCLPCEDVLV